MLILGRYIAEGRKMTRNERERNKIHICMIQGYRLFTFERKFFNIYMSLQRSFDGNTNYSFSDNCYRNVNAQQMKYASISQHRLSDKA